MRSEPASKRFPRVQIWRRGMASLIDFFGIWLLSALLGGSAAGDPVLQSCFFIVGWLLLRVVVVSKNSGQSLGRWSVDIKVVQGTSGRVPNILPLFKRELLLGLGALMALLGTQGLWITGNAGGLFLALPLLIDCGAAAVDTERRQALHDRVAQTVVVQTRRGYSLDLKVKRLLAQFGRSVKK